MWILAHAASYAAAVVLVPASPSTSSPSIRIEPTQPHAVTPFDSGMHFIGHMVFCSTLFAAIYAVCLGLLGGLAIIFQGLGKVIHRVACKCRTTTELTKPHNNADSIASSDMSDISDTDSEVICADGMKCDA
jgi:hypothetical protein